jgi:hypothetical protein
MRPITIPNPFRKLAAKVILQLHKDTFVRAIPEHQFGVGKQLGTETIISLLQNSVDVARIKEQECIITQLDIEKAYPSVDRKMMLDILNQIHVHPTAISFFQHIFLLDENYFFEGTTPQIVRNTKGLAQGCPLSPMAFAIYAAGAMNSVNKIERDNPAHFLTQCNVPKCVAYLDDMFLISSSMQEATTSLSTLITTLSQYHMTVNVAKTLNLHITAEGQVNKGLESLPALKVLGSLITLDEKIREEYFFHKATAALKVITAAQGLHHQSVLLIARMCVASKLNHLLRTMPLHHSLLSEFDTALRLLLSQQLNIAESANTDLINMPMSLSGLGIPALCDIQAASIIALQKEMIKVEPIYRLIESVKTMSSTNVQQTSLQTLPTIQHSTEGMCGCLNAYVTFMSSMSEELKNQIAEMDQHQLWSSHLSNKHQQMLESTKHQHEEQFITIKANSIHSSSSAWLRAVPFTSMQKLSDDEVTHSLNYRLGANDICKSFVDCLPENAFKKGQQAKVKGKIRDLCPKCGCNMSPYYSACCQLNTATRTARHHLIKRILATTFSQIPGCKVVVEDFHVHSETGEGNMIPDITIELHDPKRTRTAFESSYVQRERKSSQLIQFGIDLTIHDIHSTTNHDKHMKGQFAAAAEKEKAKHYREFNIASDMYIVPFGISSVGELGPCAQSLLAFIREMGERNNLDINTASLIEQISLLCETSRAEMERVYIDDIRRLINSYSSYQHRNNYHHLNTLIKDNLHSKHKPKSPPFWVKQFNKTKLFLDVCSEEQLGDQRRDELHQQLFTWIPTKDPPKDPPPPRLPPDKIVTTTTSSVSDSDSSDAKRKDRKLKPHFSSSIFASHDYHGSNSEDESDLSSTEVCVTTSSSSCPSPTFPLNMSCREMYNMMHPDTAEQSAFT